MIDDERDEVSKCSTCFSTCYKMVEICSKLNQLEAIEEKIIKKLDFKALRCELNSGIAPIETCNYNFSVTQISPIINRAGWDFLCRKMNTSINY